MIILCEWVIMVYHSIDDILYLGGVVVEGVMIDNLSTE